MPPCNTGMYYKTPIGLHKVTIFARIRNLNIEFRPTMPKANKPQVPNLL